MTIDGARRLAIRQEAGVRRLLQSSRIAVAGAAFEDDGARLIGVFWNTLDCLQTDERLEAQT